MGNVKRPVLLFVNALLNAQIAKGGDGIGRIMVIEFQGEDSKAFDEVMMVLKGFFVLEKINLYNETVIDLPGLKICPERRKIYSNSQKISMTKKEFDIFYLLAVNKGRVLAYGQIYQSVWNGYATGGGRTAVVYHIRNIPKKLSDIPALSIQCVRELGYCMEVETEELQ